MAGTFFILGIITAVAVLLCLGIGLVGMARGGEFNRLYGNKFMWARVMLQGLALLFFAIAIMAQ